MRSQNRARETSIRGFGCGRQANACEKPFRSPLTLDFGDFSGRWCVEGSALLRTARTALNYLSGEPAALGASLRRIQFFVKLPVGPINEKPTLSFKSDLVNVDQLKRQYQRPNQ